MFFRPHQSIKERLGNTDALKLLKAKYPESQRTWTKNAGTQHNLRLILHALMLRTPCARTFLDFELLAGT